MLSGFPWATVCMWKSVDNFGEPVHSLPLYMGSVNPTWVAEFVLYFTY